jgi:hypothetical protein
MPKKEYDVRVTPRRRSKVDTHKLARAILLLAAADAEKAAREDHEQSAQRSAS